MLMDKIDSKGHTTPTDADIRQQTCLWGFVWSVCSPLWLLLVLVGVCASFWRFNMLNQRLSGLGTSENWHTVVGQLSVSAHILFWFQICRRISWTWLANWTIKWLQNQVSGELGSLFGTKADVICSYVHTHTYEWLNNYTFKCLISITLT